MVSGVAFPFFVNPLNSGIADEDMSFKDVQGRGAWWECEASTTSTKTELVNGHAFQEPMKIGGTYHVFKAFQGISTKNMVQFPRTSIESDPGQVPLT